MPPPAAPPPPNFLVIGAQKSATSSVCDILSHHPQCFMTEPKEPYFFSHDEVYAKGWNWYLSLFSGASAPGKKAIGEGSTTYTQQWLYPRAVERIRKHVPETKLIYIAREPLSRIESHYLHLASKGGREMREFNDAVRNYPAYIDNSLYTKQIDAFRSASGGGGGGGWPDERILVLFFEDFRGDTGGQMKKVFRFLGVDESFTTPPGWKARHVSSEGRTDSGALRPLRKIPGFAALRDGVPAPVKEALRRILKKPITARPVWDEPTRTWAIDRLRADSHEFLTRYGKPADFWGF